MFAFLSSKKAFTLVELMVTVLILAILTAIAIPIASNVLENQRKKDCNNQIVIVKGNVQMVMSGMEDNGVPIEQMSMTEGTLNGSGGAKYWIVSKSYAPTIGNMRMGRTREETVQNLPVQDHLKKASLDDVSFATLFTFSEVMVCPFDKDEIYGYRIYGDGTVECNCPNCPNCPDYVEE